MHSCNTVWIFQLLQCSSTLHSTYIFIICTWLYVYSTGMVHNSCRFNLWFMVFNHTAAEWMNCVKTKHESWDKVSSEVLVLIYSGNYILTDYLQIISDNLMNIEYTNKLWIMLHSYHVNWSIKLYSKHTHCCSELIWHLRAPYHHFIVHVCLLKKVVRYF